MSVGKHTTSPIVDEDVEWITGCVAELRAYIESKSGQKIGDIPAPQLLDQHFDTAMNEMEGDDVVHLFGCGFGQYFVEKAGFNWVTFTDEYGTDLAVHNPATGVFGFPISSAAKRLNDPTAGRFDAIFVSLTGA